MQILIACAKLMDTSVKSPDAVTSTLPVFASQAKKFALDMCSYSVDELSELLGVNKAIAIEVRRRYNNFFDDTSLCQALYTYDGIVFKSIAPSTLSYETLNYAATRLNICSFLYGLLRPSDLIAPYRLEGSVELPSAGGLSIFEYWQSILTPYLIEKVKSDDGILINLASNEMKKLFDWKRIERETTVISPSFKIESDGKLRNITVYSKICRGEMARFILQTKPTSIDELHNFSHQGFTYRNSPTNSPLFILSD